MIAFRALMGILQVGVVAGWRSTANAAGVAQHALGPRIAVGALPLGPVGLRVLVVAVVVVDGLLELGVGTHLACEHVEVLRICVSC